MAISVGFGLLAMILLLSALVAGVVDKAPISFPILFLAIGVALGPLGARFVPADATSPVLQIVGVLTLSLILFMDGINLETAEKRHDLLVPLLTLGPGTILVGAITTGAAYFLLHLPLALAVLVGAILASTDPVVLRDLLRDPRIPTPVRQALSLESGANDVVVLPIVLVMLAVVTHRVGGTSDWIVFLLKLLVVGPALGAAIGGAGAWLMAEVDQRFPIRREYQSLYGIGLVLGAYATGVTIGVDGFLAAFAAGLAVTLLNQRLCDCFLEFGQAAAEITMLLSFVLFGALLSTLVGGPLLWPTLGLAAIVIFVARPVAIGVVLARSRALSWPARGLIAWFGPRGLNCLLFALLLVDAGAPQAIQLLTVIGTVVLVSVVLHGASTTPVANAYSRVVARRTLGEERESEVSAVLSPSEPEVTRISVDELNERMNGPNPPLVVDVRTRNEYARELEQIPGSVRVLPDHVAEWLRTAPRDRELAFYCS
jgi:sodium/hydrogen antiporter